MKGRNLYKIRRERDPVPWRYSFMVLLCVIFLATGFLYAAKTHFLAMDYGIRNEKLQKEIEELEAEQRRLKLQREIAGSPTEIEKMAKKLGFRKMLPEDIEVLKRKKLDEDASKPKISEKEESASSSSSEQRYSKIGEKLTVSKEQKASQEVKKQGTEKEAKTTEKRIKRFTKTGGEM